MCVLSGFLEKNRDALSMDIMELVRKSSNKLLKQIFEKEMNTNSVNNSNKANKIIMTPKSSLRVWDSYRADWQYWLNIDNSFSINLSLVSHSKQMIRGGRYLLWAASSVSLWILWWRPCLFVSLSSYVASNQMTKRCPWYQFTCLKLHILYCVAIRTLFKSCFSFISLSGVWQRALHAATSLLWNAGDH